ncbi:MAG: F0F1 ATP synthase subunit gamma [Bifidobacteriaceae bacterium]|jgi:F-type H+-transporting ATPase subunit gamma|nr:F0F1 ATP synthase subunit gamma [Bifidobacteriaceae bacterium]
MAGAQRVYRARISSTQALKKIFRAMELIAASRISKAREAAAQAAPYTSALTRALAAAASHIGNDIDHPLLSERHDTNRVVMLVITADRGMAGAYNASLLREAERARQSLIEQGKTVELYVMGRRGIGYYTFRNVPISQSWQGASDAPTLEIAHQVADALLERFQASLANAGVSEIHVVYTHFRSMVSQQPRVIRMLPLEVVEDTLDQHTDLFPLYEFEPSAHRVLDALLPRYIRSRVWDCLLQAAASELAARQRAMHTATDNAEDLIRQYTRLANQARQAEITLQISEIVSGADALAEAA